MSTKPRRSRRQSRRHLKPSTSSTLSVEPLSTNLPSSASTLKEPRIQTPARVLHSTMQKSPMPLRGGGISSRTPSPGKMKLTTKNLPILF